MSQICTKPCVTLSTCLSNTNVQRLNFQAAFRVTKTKRACGAFSHCEELTARKILVGLFLLLQRRCPLSSNCHRFFSLSTIRSFSLRGFHYFESIICRDLWKPRRCSEVLMFGCISLLPRVVKISEYFLKYFSPPSTGKSRNSECAPSVVLCISPTLS